KEALRRDGRGRADLVFTIRPGNPAAVGASEADWKELIAFCLEKGMRLVNDAAYAGPVPSVMAAYGEFLNDRGAARKALDDIRGLYEKRLAYLIPQLKKAGLR